MFAKTKNIILANRPLFFVGNLVLGAIATVSAIFSILSPLALLLLYVDAKVWENVFYAPARLQDAYRAAHAKARIMAKPIYFFDDCAKTA